MCSKEYAKRVKYLPLGTNAQREVRKKVLNTLKLSNYLLALKVNCIFLQVLGYFLVI